MLKHQSSPAEIAQGAETSEYGPIAIVGMACKFPGASDYREFWNNLKNGVCSVTRFSDEELENAGIDPAQFASDPQFIRYGAILQEKDVESFDYPFFSIAPNEAEVMDPQQRIFLQCAVEALEDAGHAADAKLQKVGVYAGSRTSTYLYGFSGNPYLASGKSEGFQILVGNDKDYLATRVAYKLNLRGPAVVVQSACSTSLLAAHLACEALRRGECDMAMAGGVAVMTPQHMGFHYQPGMILSPDGQCRPFDASASGTLFGNGVGIVVLKRLEDALDDKDRIRAVIRGSASNNDGSNKAGFTAPSFQGQQDVIREALANADIRPDSVALIEAHGTGTPLGDPIEFAALNSCYKPEGRSACCAVGSVKSNIGHLDAAAGVASLIKAILAVENGQLPPTVNYSALNPHINLKNSAFRISEKLSDWPEALRPRRAGVSSFGIGGTNVHLYLEEAPELAARAGQTSRPAELFVVSGRDEEALRRNLANHEAALAAHQSGQSIIPAEASFADICFSSTVGRVHHSKRRAFAISDIGELLALLNQARSSKASLPGVSTGGPLAFVFGGQVGHLADAVEELRTLLPVFARELDDCSGIMERSFGLSFTDLLDASRRNQVLSARLLYTGLFSYGHALGRSWMALGISPQFMTGSDVWEYVAAALAGVFTKKDALTILERQGRLIDSQPGVESETATTTLGFPSSHCRKTLQDNFAEIFSGISLHSPKIPLVSGYENASANEDFSNPEYWRRHLHADPSLEKALERTAESGARAFLDLRLPSPGSSNTPLPSGCSWAGEGANKGGWTDILSALGSLYETGFEIRWDVLYEKTNYRRIPLPTYSFAPIKVWREDPKRLPATTAVWKELRRAETRAELPLGEAMPVWIASLHHLAEEQLGQALSRIGVASAPMKATASAGLEAIVPKHKAPLLRAIMDKVHSVEKYQGSDSSGQKSDASAMARMNLENTLPECGGLIDFALRCGAILPQLLRGEKNAGDVLAEAASIPSASQGEDYLESFIALLSSTPFFSFYNKQLEDAVRAILRAAPSGGTVRILELNALGGGGIKHLDLLDYNEESARPEFFAAETSRHRLSLLRSSLGPSISIIQADVGDPKFSSAEQESFDVVIAGNVLHGSQDAASALEKACSLLRPGGVLLFREITECSALTLLLFGALWPECSDKKLRPDLPYLSSVAWQELALKNGFDRVGPLFAETPGNAWLGEQFFAARKKVVGKNRAFSSQTHEIKGAGGLDAVPLPYPLVSGRLDCPSPVYGLAVEPGSPPWVADHVIYGQIVVPATCYLECLAEAAHAQGISTPVLENISILQAMRFKDALSQAPQCRLMVQPPSGGERHFEGAICSRSKAVADWETHCSGSFAALTGSDLPDAETLGSLRERLAVPLSLKDFHSAFSRRGMSYGPSFLGVQSVYPGSGEALGKIVIPPANSGDSGYIMHPVLLDACLQILAAAVSAEDDSASLPVGIDRLVLRQNLPHTLWCHAILRRNESSDALLGDLNVYTEDGSVICSISGLHMRRVEESRLKNPEKTVSALPFYSLGWESRQKSAPPEFPHGWSFGGVLPSELEKEGLPDPNIKMGKFSPENTGRIFFTGPIDRFSAAETETMLRRVASEIREAGESGWKGTLGIVTQNASGTHPAAAALAAFTQAAGSEYPEMRVACIFTVRSNVSAATEAIAAILAYPRETVLRLDAGRLFVKRLKRMPSETPPAKSSWKASSSACHVIAGGTRGMGLEVACWFAGQGARHIVLIGRGSPDEDSALRLRALEESGVEIQILQADVSDSEALQSASATLGPMPEGSVLVHAAGISHDKTLRDSHAEVLSSVLAPKLAGTENLLALAERLKIGHALLFSSISTLWGTPGTSAYAAANGYLEGFSGEYGTVRVSVIHWSTFGETGLIARSPALLAMQKDAGLRPFNNATALTCLEHVLSRQPDQIVALDMDWERFFAQNGADIPLLEKIAPVGGESSPSGNQKSGQSSAADIGRWLRTRISSALGLNDADFDAETNLLQLGMDSLLFLNLAQAIKKEWHVTIAAHTLFDMPTLAGLSSWLENRLREKTGGRFSTQNSQAETASQDKTLADPKQDDDEALHPDPANRHRPFPLTDIQHAYWIGRSGALELGNIGCQSYSESDIDDLDPERYITAWNSLVRRHDMLRAVVLPDGNQLILESTPLLDIPLADLSRMPAGEREVALLHIRGEMKELTLDPGIWPLFRVRLSRITERKWRVHLVLDLLVADVFSAMLMMRELSALYENPDASLPALELSFRDYVLAERKLQEKETAARAYWMDRLNNLPPAPDLPLAKQPGEISRPEFLRRSILLPSEEWSVIKSRAAEYGVTPAAVMIAAYAEVISAWSASPRFTLNITLFNRKPLHPQVNSLVGDFTSVTLLEVDTSYNNWNRGNAERNDGHKAHHEAEENVFIERVKRLQRQLWTDLEHRDFTGVQLLREMARKGKSRLGASMPVIFTANFSQNQEDKAVLSNLAYSMTQTPQVWLDNQMYEENGALLLYWDYVDELFPEGMIEAMFEAYSGLLRSLAQEDASRPGVWERMTGEFAPPEQLAVRTANNYPVAEMRHETLYADFETMAREHPDAPALLTPELSLSYAELWQRAAALRDVLAAENLSPGEPVGVVMEKGWEQIVAVLGILQAGGAYVPIDGSFPEKRIRMLLESAKARFACCGTNAPNSGAFPQELRVLNVTLLPPVDYAPAKSPKRTSPETLAYIIYTSGSTGTPKGVMIAHAAALNTLDDINRRLKVGRFDRVLGLANLNFDLSVYDIFGVLGAGGTLILPSAREVKNPEAWIRLINEHGVTIWNSAPALLSMLLEYLPRNRDGELSSLKSIMLSGDWISLESASAALQRLPQARLYSLGGATEASIWSIIHPVEKIEPLWKSIPYGRAMDNQTMQVLDSGLRECPDNVVGEIFIGGVGLSLGYWDEPERTRESFFTHPVSGKKLYRTGDLGKYAPDGNIIFLGRKDHQVKILGHRIELGEIDAALARCPGVEQALAVATPASEGQRRLIAYWKGELGADAEKEIKEYLLNVLPEYMVPETYLCLENFPLSPSGKVDRKALPPPSPALRERTGKNQPFTAEERFAAGIWKEILKVTVDDIDADFFESGGDSLLAVKLIARIRRETEINISVTDFFSNPSVRFVARALSAQPAPSDSKPDSQAAGAGVVPLASGGTKPSPVTLYLIHDGSGTMQRFGELADELGKTHRLFGLEIPLSALKEPRMRSYAAIAGYHAKNILATGEKGPCAVIGYCAGGYITPSLCRSLRRLGIKTLSPVIVDSLPKLESDNDPLVLFRKLSTYMKIADDRLDISEVTFEVIKHMQHPDAQAESRGERRYLELSRLPEEERFDMLYAAAHAGNRSVSSASRENFFSVCKAITLLESYSLSKDDFKDIPDAAYIWGTLNEPLLKKAGMPPAIQYWSSLLENPESLHALEINAAHLEMISSENCGVLGDLIRKTLSLLQKTAY